MMRYKTILISAALLLLSIAYARAQYENVWAFGGYAGLDFNTNPPTAIQTSINTTSAAASVCDSSGQLLFYTQGSLVWDKNGTPMPNGDNLAAGGSTDYNSQGALIVPLPGTPNKYYIFSNTTYFGTPNNACKLYYSVVDMSLNNGLGDVVTGQKAILIDSMLAEKTTAFVGEHCNIWLMTVSRSPWAFKAYEITETGISTNPVISNVGFANSISAIWGGMTVSPDRKRIVAAQFSESYAAFTATIYDLDAASGIVSQPLVIMEGTMYGAYSACFSPDNSKVYVSQFYPGYLYQFDLSSNDPTMILSSQTLIGNGAGAFTSIKLAPDEKIYFLSESYTALGVINSPNDAGVACGYMPDVIPLPDGTWLGGSFPHVVPIVKRDTAYTTSILKPPCFTTTLILKAVNDTTGWDYIWNNGTMGSAIAANTPGTYWVSYHTSPCTYHVDTFQVQLDSQMPQLGALAGCKNNTNAQAWALPATGDTVTYTYTWRLGTQTIQGPLQSNNGDTLHNILNGTLYTLEASAPNGCDTVLYITTPLPDYQASFTVSDSIICMGSSVSFQNTSQGGFANYQWDFADGGTATAESPWHTYLHAGSYRVQLIAQTTYPCYDTAYATIITDTTLSGQFTTDQHSICTGQSITFTPQTDSSVLSFSWQLGDGSSMTSPGGPIQHAYENDGVLPVQLMIHFRACPDTSFTDTVHVYPLPEVFLGPDSALCLNGAPIFLQNLRPAPAVAYHRLWSTGDTVASIKVVHPGTFSLTIKTEPLGCSTTEDITINKDCYIDIPNAFTPNGDGVNDYFFPRQLLSKSVTKFRMQVLNRWGQLVFETTRTDGRGWDGQYNSKGQPQGVYVYMIDVEIDGHLPEHYQGNVTLVR